MWLFLLTFCVTAVASAFLGAGLIGQPLGGTGVVMLFGAVIGFMVGAVLFIVLGHIPQRGRMPVLRLAL